jgi:hypothetical protein
VKVTLHRFFSFVSRVSSGLIEVSVLKSQNEIGDSKEHRKLGVGQGKVETLTSDVIPD